MPGDSPGSLRWHIRFDVGLCSGHHRGGADGRSATAKSLDYYLLPRLDMSVPRLRLAEHNGVSLDAYRFETWTHCFDMAARTPVLEVA